MSDLDLEAIKAFDLDSYFDALLREWYDGVVQRGDGTALRQDLEARGLDIDALVAEVERLRAALGDLWPNLADANLADANLADANLAGANLAGADLAGAYGNEHTVPPSGWRVEAGRVVSDD